MVRFSGYGYSRKAMTRADNTRPQVQAIRLFSRFTLCVALRVSGFITLLLFCWSHCQYSSSFHIVKDYLQLFFRVQYDGFYPFHLVNVSHCTGFDHADCDKCDWNWGYPLLRNIAVIVKKHPPRLRRDSCHSLPLLTMYADSLVHIVFFHRINRLWPPTHGHNV